MSLSQGTQLKHACHKGLCIMSPKYLTSLFQWESVFIHLVSNCLWFLVSKVLSTISSSVKGLIFLCSAFLMVQLSQPCVVTGKTLALVVVWCLCIFVEFWAQENRAYYQFLLFLLFALWWHQQSIYFRMFHFEQQVGFCTSVFSSERNFFILPHFYLPKLFLLSPYHIWWYILYII